jgi:S1 RNA binding domain protein
MPVELGQVVEGTVTGITNFGAFIQLTDGVTGLCHISEIADEYVKDVKDYLKENQVVKVKVIEINGKGKISLSIRKVHENGNKKSTSSQKTESYKPSKPKESFEDMLSNFLKDSDEKLKGMKKAMNKRRNNGFNRKES